MTADRQNEGRMEDALVLALPVPGASPLDEFAGLPLIVRKVLTLQKMGVQRMAVVVGPDGDEVRRCVDEDDRVRCAVGFHADVRSAEDELGDQFTVAKAHVADGQDLSTAEGRRETTRRLFDACRKPVDGIVSRHLNRHVSIFVSKRLVNTPITPNQVTVLTFLVGVAAAFAVSRGTYMTMLVGALLFQVSSILDGVDGELARVSFRQSRLGEWIDTVGDDLTNVMLYGATALAAAQIGAAPWLSVAGWVAVGAALTTSALYYSELVSLGSGDFYALKWSASQRRPGLSARISALVMLLFKRDFFIFLFLLAAVAGVLPWMTPLMMAATLATMVAAIARSVRRAYAGAPAAKR